MIRLNNKTVIFILIFSSGLAIIPVVALGQYEQGISGPFNLNTAWNIPNGDLAIELSSRFYYNNKTFYYSNNTVSAITYWDVQGGIRLMYGLGDRYQLGLTQIFYQDNHKGEGGYNFPDDLFLSVKVKAYSLKNGAWNFGGRFLTRIPVADHHNVILEPYSAGKLEAGVFGLVSYTANPNFPEHGLNFHLNLGLIDHNDHGVNLDESGKSSVLKKHNSRELIGGVAVLMPATKFDFSAEFYGNYFVSKPPPTAFSRHSYVYFSPGITYRAFYWLSFSCGFDVRLTPNKSSSSSYIQNSLPNYLPTYPRWRLNFKMRMNLISRIKARFAEKEQDKGLVTEKKEITVYDRIAEEKKHIEEAEQELEEIIKQRKKMDEILERLKKALEINEKKKKGDKDKNSKKINDLF